MPLGVEACVRWLENREDIRSSGFEKGISTLEILRALGMDDLGCQVALIHCAIDGVLLKDDALLQDWDPISADQFHELYSGVADLARLSSFVRPEEGNADPEASEENLRRMLITMVADVRVVLIKLAEQLCLLRVAKGATVEQQQSLSRSTFELYAPLANRLGIWQIKWEMEDLAFRFSNPQTYHQLAGLLNEKRRSREQYIRRLTHELDHALKDVGIRAEIGGRPKNIYSIWKKMQRKGVAFENLWDIRAVRIIVDSLSDCYVVLGIVHTRWRHLPGAFDDYIATPKPNGYRSIHTVVIGPEGRSVEIQVRTHDMHAENELGVAAHWRYKESRPQEDNIDLKVLRLRQLLEWKQELEESESAVGALQEAAENRRVYVFTPKGTVLDLPEGATPVDFAYAIHSEVGHSTRGARINGRMVPLSYSLKTGDQVEILNQKNATPSRDWLRPELGMVRTQRARSRIQQWFKHKNHAQHLVEGRNLLEKELGRLGLEALSYDRIVAQTPFQKPDDLLVALGAGDYKLSRALLPFRRELEQESDSGISVKTRLPPSHPGSFQVHGVGNIMTSMAKCCQPVPGEPIVGFISAGRGVIVHNRGCSNLRRLSEDQRNRLIDVDWALVETNAYPVEVDVTAYHRSGILHDISQVLKDGSIEVRKVNTETDEENVIRVRLQLEVGGIKILSQTLGRLSEIPNVLDVKRVRH